MGLRRSIFYLDDDASHLELFREMFGAEYDVHTAISLDEARRMLADCSAEIIISDQLMPEVKGTEFLREAARRCPSTFRVLLSGTIVVGEVLAEVGAGVVHIFLSKPWNKGEMREALERAEAYLDAWPKPRRMGKK